MFPQQTEIFRDKKSTNGPIVNNIYKQQVFIDFFKNNPPIHISTLNTRIET